MNLYHLALAANLLLWLGMLGAVRSGAAHATLVVAAAVGVVAAALIQHWTWRNLRDPSAFAPRGQRSFRLWTPAGSQRDARP
ncbi:MAG TPA: hypothetical protein PKC43_13235 [Phycisphaerales bacterium]|nr:hypothetical protein [Phycisphaerales bacterium]HMP38396.1 hypothetical protein [Phycisphaerales bacterium]